jgi:tetratricopeptide (TPR) repeat protein
VLNPKNDSPRLSRALVLVAVMMVIPAAVAPGAQAQGDAVTALSDTRSVPTPEEALTELRGLRPVVCARGRPRSRGTLTRGRAVSRSKRFLRQRVRRGYARFLRSRHGRRARAAEDFAASSLAAKAPAGALAGFLAAHGREPRNPRHLLNASVVLVRLGMPREALALIKAAERMRAPRRPPMGIGIRALAANNRGFALIALRRYGEAERALNIAIGREPLLAEAKLNLATARLCTGRIGQAVEPYIAGRRRNASVGNVSIAALQPNAGNALDMSQGVEGKLPAIRFPPTAKDGAASYPAVHATTERRVGEASAQYTTAVSAIGSLTASLEGQPLLELNRSLELLDLWNKWESQRPDIKALRDALVATESGFTAHYGDFNRRYEEIRTDCQDQFDTSEEIGQCIKDRCIPAAQSAHTQWVPLIREADRLAREFTRELHRYATSLGANYANPAGRAAIVESARHEILTLYSSHVLVFGMDLWTSGLYTVKEDCVESGGEAQGEEGDPDLALGSLCPPELRAVKFSFKLPPFFSVGVSCETLSVEASQGGLVGPFAQVNYTFASGSTTLFAGARAGARIPGFGASAKAGMYMSFDSGGNITDSGLRATGAVSGPGVGDVAPRLSGTLNYSLAGSYL